MHVGYIPTFNEKEELVMKKVTQLTALSLVMISANAFAHHPAADIVDPEIYEMIEENISDAHLALTFDDMGGATTTEAGSSMRERDNDDSAGMGSDLVDAVASTEASEDMSSMAEAASGGPMSGQR